MRIWGQFTSRSSETVHRTKLTRYTKLTVQRATWSEQYISAVRPPRTCLTPWVFSGKWPLNWKYAKLPFDNLRRDIDARVLDKFGESPFLGIWQSMTWSSSSSRMRVMNHNWSATKQHLHPQSAAEISRHSVLSGDRIRQCETSSGSRHTDQCL